MFTEPLLPFGSAPVSEALPQHYPRACRGSYYITVSDRKNAFRARVLRFEPRAVRFSPRERSKLQRLGQNYKIKASSSFFFLMGDLSPLCLPR